MNEKIFICPLDVGFLGSDPQYVGRMLGYFDIEVKNEWVQRVFGFTIDDLLDMPMDEALVVIHQRLGDFITGLPKEEINGY